MLEQQIDLNTIGVIIGLGWCAIQEYRLSKICEKCPFLPKNKREFSTAINE
jgi:hypothetical protein